MTILVRQAWRGTLLLGWCLGLSAGSGGAPAGSSGADRPANLAATARMLVVDARGRVTAVPASTLTAPAPGASNPVELASGDLLQLDWPNPRPIRELRLRFDPATPSPAPDEIFLSWWPAAWPASRGDAAPARWRQERPEVSLVGDEVVLRFPRPGTNRWSGVTSAGGRGRTTRALRLSFARDVALRRVAVHSDAVLRRAQLRFEWGIETRVPGKWSPTFEVRNGRILSQRKRAHHAAVIEVEYAHSDDPLSPDRGRVLFRDGPRRSFAVKVDDVLAAGGLFVRDVGVFVSDPAQAPDHAHWPGPAKDAWREGTVIEQAARVPAEVFVRDLGRVAANFRAPVILGLPGLRQDFVLTTNGAVEIRTPGLRTSGADRDARPWRWPVLRWRVGVGKTPRFTTGGKAPAIRRLEENGLPLVFREWEADGLRWRQETLVAPLLGGFDALTNVTGAETAVLVSRFRVHNPGLRERTVWFWLLLDPPAPVHVALDGTLVLPTPSDGESRPGVVPVRGRLATPPGASLDLALLPAGVTDASPATRGALRCRFTLPPGGEQTLDLWVPGVELLTPPELAALKRLDFGAVRAAAAAFWEAWLATAGEVDLPEPRLNVLFRANLARLLAALERDPITGEWRFGPAAAARPVSLDELATVTRRLTHAGQSRAAARLLATVLAHQGRRAPAGAQTRRAGAFTAQSAEEPDPFGASAPAWQHAAFLSRLTEPGFTAPRLGSAIENAATWIQAGLGEDGLMLPAPVRPGSGWVRAFATDGANARALFDVADWFERRSDPTPAGRWRAAAKTYRDRLLGALAAGVAETPIVRLRDGNWIPGVPWRIGALMDGLGERREELAASSLRLVNDGILAPDDPFTDWLLQNLEDNLLLGGLRVTGAGRTAWNPALPGPAPPELDLAAAYLARDQIGLCWRALRNLLATRLDPESLTLAAGGAGRLPDQLAAECRFLEQLRETLVRELPDRLDLCAGLPRSWLMGGKGLHLRRFPTAFGRLDLSLEPLAEDRGLRAHVRLAEGAPPRMLRLRLRPPAGRAFREVRVNGRRVRLRAGWAELPPSPDASWDARAKY